MTTKVKGLLKGLRYISQIFDEEKEKEGDIQIGFPTDVKHVAHIGCDGNGPAADSPSWMKDFSSTTGYQSAPLAMTGGDHANNKDNPDIKWASQDSKSCRHIKSSSENPDSPKKESSRRHSRRKSKESVSVKSNQQLQDSTIGSESPARSLPDIPKKTRRKKSKENVTAGGSSSTSVSSRSSRSKDGSVRSRKSDRDDNSQTSSLKPPIQSGEMESSAIS